MAFRPLSSPVTHCTVTSRPDTGLRVMLKWALSPSAALKSPMKSSGSASSSVMDTLALYTVRPGDVPCTVSVSSSSSSASWSGVSVKVFWALFCPAGMMRSKLVTGA